MNVKRTKFGVHEDPRKNILRAAKNLFSKKGYKATSIRKIAAEVGISPTTIYLYFKGKAEIIYALHQEGFKMLNEQFKTLENVEQPFERLKAMGLTYIDFALENRDYYEIMFSMKEPVEHLQESNIHQNNQWEEGEAAFQALVKGIEDCQGVGYFKGLDSYSLALLLWSNMHGICTLKNNGRLELLVNKTIDQIDPSEVLKHSFNLYAKILESI